MSSVLKRQRSAAYLFSLIGFQVKVKSIQSRRPQSQQIPEDLFCYQNILYTPPPHHQPPTINSPLCFNTVIQCHHDLWNASCWLSVERWEVSRATNWCLQPSSTEYIFQMRMSHLNWQVDQKPLNCSDLRNLGPKWKVRTAPSDSITVKIIQFTSKYFSALCLTTFSHMTSFFCIEHWT